MFLGDYMHLVFKQYHDKNLFKSRSSFINYTYCNQYYATSDVKVDEQSKICYGNLDLFLVPDTCRMAPGAPLTQTVTEYTEILSIPLALPFPYIFGLSTIAKDCGFGYPALVTKVSHYIDWIDSVIFPGKAKTCLLPAGTSSICKRASECPHLVGDVKKGKSTLSDYICQFDDARDLLVCCPKLSSGTKYDYIESEFQKPHCVSFNIEANFRLP